MKGKFRRILASLIAAVMLLAAVPMNDITNSDLLFSKAKASAEVEKYLDGYRVYEVGEEIPYEDPHLTWEEDEICPNCGKSVTVEYRMGYIERTGDDCWGGYNTNTVCPYCGYIFCFPWVSHTTAHNCRVLIHHTSCADWFGGSEPTNDWYELYCPACKGLVNTGNDSMQYGFYCWGNDKITHDYELYEDCPPTCTAQGYKEYHCKNCWDCPEKREYYGIPTGHNYEFDHCTATCTEDGLNHYRCTNNYCGDGYTDFAPATGHSYEYKVVKPTCTAQGYTEATCKSCGESHTENYVPATGHTYERTVIKPTCKEQGYTLVKCKDCSYSYKENYVAATGHTWNPWVIEKAATATETGLRKHTCISCGTVESEVIPKTAASEICRASLDNQGADSAGTIILWYKYNTVENGVYYYYDSACARPFSGRYITCPVKSGYTFDGYFTGKNGTGTQYVAADGYINDIYKTADSKTLYAYWIKNHTHSYTSEITKTATCTEAGVKTFTCSCGDSYTETIPATGHRYTQKITAPTCTQQGYTTYTCACGDSYVSDYVKATGHSFGEWTVTKAATTTAAGIKERKCSKCGAVETEVIPQLQHTHSYSLTKTVNATCTQNGSKTFTCSCGDSYTETIPATGHRYTQKVTAPTCTQQGYTTYTCACGDSYVSDYVKATGHSFGEWTVTKAATTTAAGTKERKCSKCGAVETAVIPKLASAEICRASLDNQGADTPGTIILWYKYNTVENGVYYYLDSACARPFAGTKIVCPTKDGYTFGGYFTGKNGTGTQYVAADGYINDVYKTSDSKTLYAYWIENSGETGDVNSDGAINSNDALWILEYSVGQRVFSDDEFIRADINKDNNVNSLDALYVLQYTVGQIDKL